MTPKIAKILLTAAPVIALLLIASSPFAFGQGVSERGAAQSLEITRQAEELLQEALILSGTKERELGRVRLLEAVRLWMQVREPEKAARACLQMGDCFKQDKRHQESLYYYKQALEIKPLSGAVKAIALSSIAQVYADLYQTDLALHYYGKANNHARLAKNISAQALALTGLADVHLQQGEREQAITCIVQARQLNRQQGNDSAEASLIHLAGRIDQEKGLLEQARKAFEEALAIYQRINNAEGQVKVLCSISNLYLFSDQRQMALEQAERAVDLAEKQAELAVSNADKTRARELRWRAWLSQARAQRAVGQIELAIKSFKRAIHHVEGIYWSVYISTEASAIAFREECQAPYREFIDLLIEQGETLQAYEWAQLARARAMMGLIEARRTTGLPKKPQQEDALREMSRSIARLRTQLLSSQTSAEQQARLQKDIRDEEYKMRETHLRAEMERSRARLVWAQPATVKQLQEKMAQDKQIILEFLLGENRSFVWLISFNEVSLEILPGRKEIEKAVRQYSELLTVAPNNMYIERDMSKLRGRAERLFSILFGRLSKQIAPGQKLIIVPDGLLHYLPFEALLQNGHFLVEDHEISYLPTAGLFGIGQVSRSRTETESKMEFLAFGDPAFNRKEPGSAPNDTAQQMRASRGFHLAPLPRTRDEVKYIASLFPSDRQHVYLGKDSTEKAVKQESLRRYRRLHFATHGLIDERSPSQSAVVLTLDDDPEEDGFLEVSEIPELDLDCDLVVLSACQTGRGQLLSGEGIVGLSRAFLHAGARAVVVSLWNVSDISTGQMMKGFYQHLISNVGNAAALREAKLQMVERGREMRHPYYWAPFIIVGKP